MSSIGGDISEVTWNHPTLGTGRFAPKSGEDSSYVLGGLTTDDDENGVDGQGQPIYTMTRQRPSFDVVVAWDMNNDLTLEKAQALAESPIETDWTITNAASGVVYGMKGKPVGTLTGNGKNATFPLKVAGGGKLKKIA